MTTRGPERRPTGAAAVLGLAALACAGAPACGGDDEAAHDRRAAKLAWTPCWVDYECATVDVPVDYSAPGGAHLGIALLRAPAGNSDERLGTVVVNPGGPGIPMVEQLARTYRTLKLAFPVATDRFDIVAFDWRGVGASAPVECASGAFFDDLRKTDLTLADVSSVPAVDALRRRLVDGCRALGNDALLSSLHTENAARDLDRVREALGEEKLNYLGLSFGTWLGATYATLFPDRVRAFALDSAVVLAPSAREQLTGRARAFDLGLARFAEACAKDGACAFHGGTTPALVSSKLDALADAVRAGGVAAAGQPLSIVDFFYALGDGLRVGNASKLAADLAKAEAGDGAGLRARADTVTGRRADGTYDGNVVGLLAIACLDQAPAAPSVDEFRTFVRELSPAPRARGAAGIPFALCTDWPWKRATPPTPISARSAPPMLVTGTRSDPITTYAMTQPLLDALGNGSHLVTYEGDGHVAATHSACVRAAITEFMIDPKKPPAVATCPAE